ncbi:hypothetical protein PJI21_28995, partial [Mycobacterium kansasii]
ENPTEGEKARSPAWCDRIIWSGIGIKQHFYRSADIKLSDHHPVSSAFSIEVEVLNPRQLRKTLMHNNIAASLLYIRRYWIKYGISFRLSNKQ